ncbi:MAG: ATP-binding protein [bacterium]
MSEDLLKHRWLSLFLPTTSTRRLVILTGARQTGKTTLAQLIYSKLNYINCDAPENRDMLREVHSAHWGKSIGNAVIDEAQKEPIVFEKIKYAYDAHKISFCILLGSSQILLLKRIRESLAGRVFIYELWPLMLSELVRDTLSKDQSPLISHIINIKNSIGLNKMLRDMPSVLMAEVDAEVKESENYLCKWGGMPELLHLSDSERREWLKSYEYTYLERDLSDLARLDDLNPFRKFQKLSALRSAQLLNYSELARDAGISVDTARRYLEYLKLSYQTFLLPPFYENLTSTVIKSPKIYWLDCGILRQLSGFTGEITGHLFENMVIGEIYKWIKTSKEEAELFYYRTRGGLEVDLLIKTPYGIIGFEIKNRRNIIHKDYRALCEIGQKLGDRWIGGICVNNGNSIIKVAEPNIWAIASNRLFR